MRLRTLSETECYIRCYGRKGDESVRIVRVARDTPRNRLTGEHVRRLFEDRLAAREPEAEAA